MTRVGVLGLQGAFVEHVAALQRLGVEAFPVRLPGELRGLDGLVIPGGESTTISKLMADYRLCEELRELISGGMPVLGTCAGMILLAGTAVGLDGRSLGLMDIRVRRNAFGRQVDSFEVALPIAALGEPDFPGVFIRAPAIEKVGDGVEVLARLADGTTVAARERNVLVAAFHPELTSDLRFHQYFLTLIGQSPACDDVDP